MKRVRVFGTLLNRNNSLAANHHPVVAPEAELAAVPHINGFTDSPATAVTEIPALWLTPEAFAPFGQVIQGWNNVHSVPKGVRASETNQGTAVVFDRLTTIKSSYPPASGAVTAIAVFRASPKAEAAPGKTLPVRLLERHPCMNQAYIPMSNGGRLTEDAVPQAPRAYLVVVALNGADDKPDLASLRAFVASTAQGVVYDTGIWRESASDKRRLRS